MFTGIVTDVGHVRAVKAGGDARLEIETRYDTTVIAPGVSICCSGACLTVIDKGPGWFAAQVSAETLARTTLGAWRKGTPVNLERALKVGDELGGHLVAGHVDGVGALLARVPEGESARLRFSAPAALMNLIAPKGSLAVDGVSLTVNEVDAASFGVNVIPHTQKATTLGRLKAGDRVNLEIDLIARYVARLLGKG